MRKLKIDLHTHMLEAANFAKPDAALAEKVVAQMRERGLEGIALTEHWNVDHGWKLKEIIEDLYGDEFVILVGQELDISTTQQVTEVSLPDGVTYRDLCHHGYLANDWSVPENLHGIEIENGMHSWHLNRPRIRELAEEHNLMLLKNSDAHYLEKIGVYYNELAIEELVARATGQPLPLAG